ncbi:MAG: hypothetical protein J6Y87_00305 [Muribaculaceae bacterium]|nr:hypothetical protein [Muribaculaceae bacterium]
MAANSVISSKGLVMRLGAVALYLAIAALFVTLFPGETLVTTLLYSLLLLVVAESLYYFTSTCCRNGEWLIFGVCLLLTIGNILNIYYFTTAFDSTPQFPHLQNSDAATNYYVAYKFFDQHYYTAPVNPAPIYRWLICHLWRITGVTVAAPIFVNSIFIAWAVIFSGLISRNVLRDYRPSTSLLAMGLTAAVCYYINSGTIILKDAAVCLSVAMLAFAFTYLRTDLKGRRHYVYAYTSLILGGILLALFRVNYLLPVALGAVILTPWTNRQRWHGLAMIAVCVALWIGVEHIFPHGSISFRVTTYVDGYGFGKAYFQEAPTRDIYYSLYGNNYFRLPVWQKILFAPIGAAVQYLTPFPWNFSRDAIFGPTLVYAHITYPWYAIGGLIIYFFIFRIWKAEKHIILWAIWGLAFWLVPVYMFAGAVSRYALPVLPILIPLAILAWRSRQRKSFKYFAITYVVLLAGALCGAYFIQI